MLKDIVQVQSAPQTNLILSSAHQHVTAFVVVAVETLYRTALIMPK